MLRRPPGMGPGATTAVATRAGIPPWAAGALDGCGTEAGRSCWGEVAEDSSESGTLSREAISTVTVVPHGAPVKGPLGGTRAPRSRLIASRAMALDGGGACSCGGVGGNSACKRQSGVRLFSWASSAAVASSSSKMGLWLGGGEIRCVALRDAVYQGTVEGWLVRPGMASSGAAAAGDTAGS